MPSSPRFEGKFAIPPSHPVESLLTQALYRLPESVSVAHIEQLTADIVAKVEEIQQQTNPDFSLTPQEKQILNLKLARHFQNKGGSMLIDTITLVDALVESPQFLQSDKGGIQKLFEMHEIKTLQRIAEIRRKRAEMAGSDEGLNLYENLFETKSGRYYLARLLNMPHLENESEYMRHCVGTSTSYMNKITRGDVEIFSFRDKETHNPLVTIEYDTKTHTILQVKKQSDLTPTLKDDFAPELMEALAGLRNTLDDTGKKREIHSNEVQHLKKLLALQQKSISQQKCTREDLLFLYEINEPIQGFDASVREPLIEELRKDRNTEEDMLVIFECTREEIAHEPSQINEKTKAYVGPLYMRNWNGNIKHGFKNIFHKLATMEYIYLSFPDRRVRRQDIAIGVESNEELISKMVATGITVNGYVHQHYRIRTGNLWRVLW